MEIFFVNPKAIGKIKKSSDMIARELKVKIKTESNQVSIEGEAINEYNALNIIKAVSAGFDIKQAVLLLNDDVMLEEIKVKDYAKPSRLMQIKARVIGTEGRALKTISLLSGCLIKLSENSLFLLGNPEDVKAARNALISIIKGGKHSNVYARLEHRAEFGEDLHLKPEKKK